MSQMTAQRSRHVDLNYLFHRQQVERSRAEAAKSEAARRAHALLASEYEHRIEQFSNGHVKFPAERRGSAQALVHDRLDQGVRAEPGRLRG